MQFLQHFFDSGLLWNSGYESLPGQFLNLLPGQFKNFSVQTANLLSELRIRVLTFPESLLSLWKINIFIFKALRVLY